MSNFCNILDWRVFDNRWANSRWPNRRCEMFSREFFEDLMNSQLIFEVILQWRTKFLCQNWFWDDLSIFKYLNVSEFTRIIVAFSPRNAFSKGESSTSLLNYKLEETDKRKHPIKMRYQLNRFIEYQLLTLTDWHQFQVEKINLYIRPTTTFHNIMIAL